MRSLSGGDDDSADFVLACDRCNLHTGPNLTGIDPQPGEVVPLFRPRRQSWRDHFRVRGMEIVGLTPTGRATARWLSMNATRRVQLRAALAESSQASSLVKSKLTFRTTGVRNSARKTCPPAGTAG